MCGVCVLVAVCLCVCVFMCVRVCVCVYIYSRLQRSTLPASYGKLGFRFQSGKSAEARQGREQVRSKKKTRSSLRG
jgi:hypothetical protein